MSVIEVTTVHEVEYIDVVDGRKKLAPPKTSIRVDIDTAAELERAGAIAKRPVQVSRPKRKSATVEDAGGSSNIDE